MLNMSNANEPGFGPPTTGRLSFSSYPSLLSEASAGAQFLWDRGVRHPFLFRDTSIIYGRAYCSGFQQTWEHLGGTIAGSADFENTDESVASQVSELRDSDADAVVMCSYPPGGASAIKQIRSAGIDVPIQGPAGFDGTFWLKGIPSTKEIFATSNGSAYDPPNAETAKLFEQLKRNGVDTDVSSALLGAYAGGQLILDAIRETHSVNGNTLADALEAKAHHTVVGDLSYTKDRSPPDPDLADLLLRDRQAGAGGKGQAAVHPRIRRLGHRALAEGAFDVLAERRPVGQREAVGERVDVGVRRPAAARVAGSPR